MPTLEPPEDPLITTIYIAGLCDDQSKCGADPVTETDLRNFFYQFGEIRSITMASKGSCALVQFAKRSSAEVAAEKTFNKLVIKGRRLTVRWGKSQAKQSSSTVTSSEGAVPNIPGLPGALPMPPPPGDILRNDFFNLAPPNPAGNFFLPPPGMMPPGAPIHYPSQDPTRMGAMQPHFQQ